MEFAMISWLKRKFAPSPKPIKYDPVDEQHLVIVVSCEKDLANSRNALIYAIANIKHTANIVLLGKQEDHDKLSNLMEYIVANLAIRGIVVLGIIDFFTNKPSESELRVNPKYKDSMIFAD